MPKKVEKNGTAGTRLYIVTQRDLQKKGPAGLDGMIRWLGATEAKARDREEKYNA